MNTTKQENTAVSDNGTGAAGGSGNASGFCNVTPLGEKKEQRCNIQGNVVLQEVSDGFVSSPKDANSDMINAMNSTECTNEFVSVMNRWQMLSVLTWETSQYFDMEVGKIRIWRDVFNAINDLPSSSVMDMFRFMRADLEFKFVLNANDFQCGQLIMASRYAHELDRFRGLKESIFNLTQTNHIIVAAGSGSEGTIIIKHNSPVNFFTINDRELEFNDLATIVIKVLSPLKTSTAGSQSVDVSIYVRLFNVAFSGMIAKSLAYTQMLPTMMAMKLLDQIYPDKNRDKPPKAQCTEVMKPTSNQSLSLGANLCEPLFSLRLDAQGQTPHPGITSDEDVLSKVTRIFGLLFNMDWKTSDGTKTMLKVIEASPLWSKSDYHQVTAAKHESGKMEGELASYSLPPVAVATSLAQYYSGDLEFRFDVIATKHHNGRLLVCFVPGSRVIGMDIKKARGSIQAVLTVCGATQFNFTVPFISDRPVISKSRTKYTDTYTPPIGYLYIFVQNALKAPETCSQVININCYVRGGSNFSLYLLSAPSIGLGYDRRYELDKSSIVMAKAGYFPYYTGTWHLWCSGNYLIFRWGAASDQVAQFVGGKNGLIARRITTYEKDHLLPNYYDSNKKNQKIDYIGIIEIGGYFYGVPFSSKNSAFEWAKSVATGTDAAVAYQARGIKYVQSGEWYDSIYGNVEYAIQDVSAIVPQMDPRENTVGDECRPVETNIIRSKVLFGERPLDFKDACRRYGLYFVQKDLDISKSHDYMSAIWKIPLCLEGVDMESNLNDEYFSRTRENHIQILTSAYPFYRGSLRVKLFPVGFKVLWAQHQFDHHSVDRGVETINYKPVADMMLTSSYAMHQIHCDVNPVMELELPFYNPGKFCLNYITDNYTPRINEFNGLGNLLIGGINDSKNVSLSMYLSVADDMQLFNFQGFPPMVFLNEIPLIPPKPQYVATTQGWPSDALKKMSDPLVKSVEEQGNKIHSTLTAFLTWLQKSFLGKLVVGFKNIIVNVVSHVLHVLASPTIFNVAISAGAILLTIGLIPEEWIDKITTKIRAYWKWITGAQSDDEPIRTNDVSVVSTSEVRTQNDVTSIQSEKVVAGLCSAIYCGIASALKVTDSKYEKSSKLNRLSDSFLKLGQTARDSNQIFIFFKNLLEFVQESYKKIIRIKIPALSSLDQIKNVNIREWLSECNILLTPSNFDSIRTDTVWRRRLDLCLFTATQLMNYSDHVNCTTKERMPLFREYYNALIRISREVGDAPQTGCKIEPYVVWMHGAPGVGKSVCASHIGTNILKKNGFKTSSKQIYYTVQPTNKHWDQLFNAPILLYDDFFSIKNMDSVCEASFMALKSSTPFVPPRAHLDEKGQEYTPEIIVVCSNVFGAEGQTHIQDTEAFNRRRDVVLEVTKEGDFAAEFAHLKFKSYSNVIDQTSEKKEFNNFDHLMEFLAADFRKHKMNQIQIAVEKLKSLSSISEGDFMEKNAGALEAMFEAYNTQSGFDWYCPVMDKMYTKGSECCRDCTLSRAIYEGLDPHKCLFCEVKTVKNINFYANALMYVSNKIFHPSKLCDKHNDDHHHAHIFSEIHDKCYLCSSVNQIANCDYKTFLLKTHYPQCVKTSAYKDVDANKIKDIMAQTLTEEAQIKSWFTRTKEYIWNKLLKPIEFVRKHKRVLKWIICGLAGLGIITGSWSWWKHSQAAAVVGTTIIPTAYEQLVPSGSTYVSASKTSAIVSKLTSHTQSAVMESNSPLEVVQNMLLKNTCTMINTTNSIVGRVIAVKGNLFLGIDHYFLDFKNDDLIEFVYFENNVERKFSFKFEKLSFKTIPNSHLVLFTVPNSVKTFRDISRHFGNIIDHSCTMRVAKIIEICHKKGYRVLKHYDVNITVCNVDVKDFKGDQYTVNNVYSYGAEHAGMCGSVLICNNKIMGLHFAGGRGKGFSEPVSFELFNNSDVVAFQANCISIDDYINDDIIDHNAENKFITTQGGEVLGKIKKKEFEHHEKGERNVFESMIHGELPVLRAPPIISINDPRNVDRFDPLEEGLKKQFQGPKDLDCEIVEQVCLFMNLKFMELNPRDKKEVLEPLNTFEAINGIDNVDGYKAIEMSTSPGWPFNKGNGYPGKHKFLSSVVYDGVLKYFPTDHFTDMMKNEIDARLKGKRMAVFENCLKSNHLLPLDKFAVPGKTRIINMSPLPYTILFRKYFLHCLATVQKNRINNTSAIGINRNSIEWLNLYNYLFRKEDKYACSGDFSNFGPTLYKPFVINAYKILFDWTINNVRLSKKDKMIMRTLCYEALDATYLYKDTLYRTNWGSPSGHPATVIINDLVAKQILLYCWAKITREPLFKFYEHIRLCTYGDDVIFSASLDVLQVFNISSIHNELQKYGIKFTNSFKSEYIIPYENVAIITFLKCMFFFYTFGSAKLCLAKLPEESYRDIPNWVKRGNNIVNDSAIACESALVEAFGIGKEAHDMFREQLNEAAAKHGLSFNDVKWEDLYYKFFSQEDVNKSVNLTASVQNKIEYFNALVERDTLDRDEGTTEEGVEIIN